MGSRAGDRTRIQNLELFVVAWDDFVEAGARIKEPRIIAPGVETAEQEFIRAREAVVAARKRCGPIRVSPERPSGISEGLARRVGTRGRE